MLRYRLSWLSFVLASAFGCSDSAAELSSSPEPSGPQEPLTPSDGHEGGCGDEAAHGGYTKLGGDWDGSAGNPYGYPAALRPPVDCGGFGFHDTCSFYESCIYACANDDDCPTVADSGPSPECRARVPPNEPGLIFTEEQVCVLPCAATSVSEDCPVGMKCVSHPYGFGDLCMWPR